jgi:hypothetical protein
MEYNNKANITSPNKRYMLTALFGRFGFRKTPVGASAFVGFYSTTFLQPCKTFGFAYSGCKNVIYLERYATYF